MATIMSGLGFQEMISSIGPHNDVETGAQRKISRSETIHSGHFMVSEIEDSEQVVEQESIEPSHESDYERPSESTDPLISYDLETNCKETTQTYVYGPEPSNTVSIDGSLTKLFECMSLAYSGKITSPRWKTFKGLKLKLKDKIRLNNIIWRAWHIQYIAGRNPIVCQFSSPVDSDRHKKAEAVILEGKYWKRRLATVTAEYQKWRLYHRRTGRPQTPSRPSSFDWENWTTSFNTSSDFADDYCMDFTDSLFSQLLQPNLIDFPNPREIARSGMGAEFMQPGLVQLQPNLDDFMDTFEPLQEFFFTSRNMSSLPTLPEETNVENSSLNVEQQNSKISQNIPEISTPDLLNSLLCSTTTANSTPIQTFSVNNKNIVQNQTQMNSELQIGFKPIQGMQTANRSLSLSAPAIHSMPTINDMTAIQSKPMQDSMYTQFTSPVIATQSSVPLTQSQQTIHSGMKSKSRESGANDFAAQTDNTSYSSLNISQSTQPFGVKSSPFKKKYINHMSKTPVSPEAINEKFIVPKTIPIKQRSRERSISTPHINRDNSAIHAFPQLPPPVSAMSLTDIPSSRGNQYVERSSSLPVYTQERRRSVASMQRNATNSTSASSANISYQTQHSLQPQQQSINKLQVIGQTPMASYGSPQFVVSNPYDISQGSSSGSTLIARLLTSNSLNNISTESSPQMYSNPNQSSAQTLNFTTSASDRPTTIDASCIGIRTAVTTGANEKPQYVFAPNKYKEQNICAMSGQMVPNMKQDFIMQSNPNVCSPPSLNQMPSLAKSRSSPVGMTSPKEISFSAIHSIPSPPSLSASIKTKTKVTKDRIQYKEHRRVCHINAEQKRRCNIKNGFDTMRSLLPSISQNSNTKISKAAMLHKAAEHIRQLKNDRLSQQEEYDLLKQQVENLNQTIGVFQNQLPATGVPFSSQRSTQTREFYENYVRERTLQNWKFWIFSIIMESLWDSYNNTVSTSNGDEMSKTLFRWLDQNCSLIRLRKDVLNSLRFLSTSTNILTDPKSLPDEAVLAVTKKEKPLSS